MGSARRKQLRAAARQGGGTWAPEASANAPRPASRELAKISRRAGREMPEGYGIVMLSSETIAAELDILQGLADMSRGRR